jgi:uncharacterized protein (TIGR02246 family)
MARSLLRIALLAVLVCSSAESARAADTGPAAVDAAWVKGMKANDADAVVKCYAPDAVAWLPDSPAAQGEKAIRSLYEGLLSANTVNDAVLSEVREKHARNVAVRWGKFLLTLTPKAGGDRIVMSGRFSEVLERRAGRWVYVVDHASAEPAATPATK